MSSNYRGQIDDHFRKEVADLIARLRDLLAKDEINEDTKNLKDHLLGLPLLGCSA